MAANGATTCLRGQLLESPACSCWVVFEPLKSSCLILQKATAWRLEVGCLKQDVVRPESFCSAQQDVKNVGRDRAIFHFALDGLPQVHDAPRNMLVTMHNSAECCFFTASQQK